MRFLLLLVLMLGLLSCSSGNEEQSRQTSLPTLPEEVNWSTHIAPILYRACVVCHRPNQVAPFSLLDYEGAAVRAKLISAVTQSRYMPPWPADANYSHFLEERVLSEYDIALLAKWAETGAQAGNLSQAPAPPIGETDGWLGKADWVVQLDQPVRIPGNNREHFWIVKVPFELPFDTFVRAVEFVPGHKRLVHHMNGHLIRYPNSSPKDVFAGLRKVDPSLLGYETTYELLGLLESNGQHPPLVPSVVNYLPGMQPVVYPQGIGGWSFTRKGVFLFRDIHYGASPVDTFDQPELHIYFMPEAPKRPTKEMMLGTNGLSRIDPPLVIPPGTISRHKTAYVLTQDISVLTINPHMHLLGKEFWAYAILPAGDTVPIIRIPQWDFRWQYNYTFPKMLHLPGGSRIEVWGSFDNMAENPNNPHHPPIEVREPAGNMRSTDEMFQLIITYLPYKAGDEHISLDLKKDTRDSKNSFSENQ